MFIAYVVVSSLLALVCLVFGGYKVTAQPGMVEQMGLLGVSRRQLPVLGAMLILGAIGLVVGNWVGPVGVAAGIALTIYFIGATLAHTRLGDFKNASPATVLIVVAAVAFVLRLLTL